MDELLEHLDCAERELDSAEPVSSNPETLAEQLTEHMVIYLPVFFVILTNVHIYKAD